MGLGSAISVIHGQIRLPAYVIGAISVTVYLGCVSILHITTASILHLETVTLPGQHTISTTSSVPIFPRYVDTSKLLCTLLEDTDDVFGCVVEAVGMYGHISYDTSLT